MPTTREVRSHRRAAGLVGTASREVRLALATPRAHPVPQGTAQAALLPTQAGRAQEAAQGREAPRADPQEVTPGRVRPPVAQAVPPRPGARTLEEALQREAAEALQQAELEGAPVLQRGAPQEQERAESAVPRG